MATATWRTGRWRRQLRDAQCHTIWEGTENICALDVRRAMLNEGAHRALLARVERALDAADPSPALAGALDAVAATLTDARDAIKHLEGSSNEMQLLHARRFAHLLADLAEGALLLDEATWQLARDGDARKAVVAGHFARKRLAPPRVRGIVDDDRTVLDLFEPLVRYGPVEPAAAVSGGDDRARLVPTVVWRAAPSVVVALDERLGPPVDGYVNGTQTWLTDHGPGRRDPRMAAPSRRRCTARRRGAGRTTSGTRSSARSPPAVTPSRSAIGDEHRPLASLWDGLECFAAYGDEIEPATLARAATEALGIPPDAAGLVDHDRIGDAWEQAKGAVSLTEMLFDELEPTP